MCKLERRFVVPMALIFLPFTTAARRAIRAAFNMLSSANAGLGRSQVLEKLAKNSGGGGSVQKKALYVSLVVVLVLIFVFIAREPSSLVLVRERRPPKADVVDFDRESVCLEGLKSKKFGFWLQHQRDQEYVCKMYAQAYAEMKGEVGHGVPKIIHQSWKTTDVKDDFRVWADSWKRANPKYEYWFWTDQDNRELVETYYPEFVSTYDTFPANIVRADFVRGLYMHRYGGVYADLDTWCLRPVDSLFSRGSRKAYVAEMGPETGFTQNLPNAFFASAPGHPFWIFFAKCAVELMRNLRETGGGAQIEQIAGPLLLKQAVDAWNSIHSKGEGGEDRGDPTLEIIKSGRVFVEDWHAETDQGVDPSIHATNERLWESCPAKQLYREEVEEGCREAFPEAVVLTFWSHTW